MICPNLSNPQVRQEFNELKSVLGEDMAYLVWDRNNGFPMDKTSTGKPSKLFNDLLGLTSRQNAIEIKAKTFSNAFKQWFGDSKVVDENGEPLVVYHGTDNTFSEFKLPDYTLHPDGGELGKGLYFTSDMEYINNIMESSVILPVFLNIKNPYIIKQILYKQGDSNVLFDNIYKTNLELDYNFKLPTDFDGIYGDDILQQVVVSSPNQIKSIFNTGVFNRYSDNIYDNDIVNQEINHQQTKINGSMSTEIVSNFETYFPDYTYLNDDQRKIVADLVEQGRIQLSCTI